MDDKCIMENMLITEKGLCDLYLHGTIESATPHVNQAFGTVLSGTLCMQSDIYQKMAAKGWYPAEQAQQEQKDKVKQKYSMTQASGN